MRQVKFKLTKVPKEFINKQGWRELHIDTEDDKGKFKEWVTLIIDRSDAIKLKDLIEKTIKEEGDEK